MAGARQSRGFSLLEVMIGVFLSTILTTGIMQLVLGSVSAYRLQLSLSQLEESSRYAHDVLVTQITQAGYQPEPWKNPAEFSALTDESLNGNGRTGDQLGLQRWSRDNCYGNENPVKDDSGQPAFYLLQTRFRVNTRNNLAMTCRYGPDASGLKLQINNFGLVENIESMQVLFAEDQNGDDIADRWVPAQNWQQESAIRAVKVGLLFSAPQALEQDASTHINLLDETIKRPADGQLRKVKTVVAALRGRL